MKFKTDTRSGLSIIDEARYRELWRNRQIWAQLRGGRATTWQGMRGDGRDGRLWIGAREVAENEMDIFQCVRQSKKFLVSLTELTTEHALSHSLLPLLREALNETTKLIAEGIPPAEAYDRLMKPIRASRQVHYDVFSANARCGLPVKVPSTAILLTAACFQLL